MTVSVGSCCSAPGCNGRCGDTSRLTDIAGADYQNTVARRLVPTADRLRNLLTRFGLRPYKVRMVVVRWSEGFRGRGVPNVLSVVDMLPTPAVLSLDGVTQVVNPVGEQEEGTISLSEISGCYTEEQLRGQGPQGEPIPPSDEFFYEIEWPKPNGMASVKRRFNVRGAPAYQADNFQWTVRLERSLGDRNRAGKPRR